MLSQSTAAAVGSAVPTKPQPKRGWLFGAAVDREEDDLDSVSEFQLVEDDDVISVADTESVAPSLVPSRCPSSMSFDMLQLDDDAASVFSDMSVISRAVTPAINIPARPSSWAYLVAKDKAGSSSLVASSAIPVSEYLTETDQLVEDEADDIVNNLPSATYGDDDELYDDEYDDYDDGYSNGETDSSILQCKAGGGGGGGKMSRKEVKAENVEKMIQLREKLAKVRAFHKQFQAKHNAQHVAALKAEIRSAPAPTSSGSSKLGLKRSKVKV